MRPRLSCSATCYGPRTARAASRRENQVTCQPKQHELKDEHMQEDDKEANGSQPESEGQPPPESEADEGQPQPQGQPPPESEAGESQPKAGTQPSTATPIPPARPIALPPTQRRKRWQYFLGLVLGLIPVIVFLVGYGFALGTTGGALNALGP